MAIRILLLSAAGGSPLPIGGTAPDFAIQPLEGASFAFADATRSHAAVVVVFLSVLCPYSNSYEVHLSELDRRFSSRGVLFVGINSNRTETLDEIAAHARQAGVAFSMMRDARNKVADLLGARVTPEAFVFDREAKLRYRGRVRSKIGSPDLQDALQAVLDGRPVKTPVAKAFGCTIVRE